ESAQSLLEFLNKILDLIRLDDFGIQENTFNIRSLLDNIAKLMHPSLTMKSLQLIIDCPDTIITTDQTRLECMLMNLTGNAIKFTQKGSITIRIKLTPSFYCEVEDTGIGIPEEKWETIFDKFYRLTSTYQEPKLSGIGLGLYISRVFARE